MAVSPYLFISHNLTYHWRVTEFICVSFRPTRYVLGSCLYTRFIKARTVRLSADLRHWGRSSGATADDMTRRASGRVSRGCIQCRCRRDAECLHRVPARHRVDGCLAGVSRLILARVRIAFFRRLSRICVASCRGCPTLLMSACRICLQACPRVCHAMDSHACSSH
jgi:hypothetical protein